jgi:hypothetical protein
MPALREICGHLGIVGTENDKFRHLSYSLANDTRACMLNSSGRLVVLTPPILSNASFTTPAAGSDAPSDPAALEEKDVKRAKCTECFSL